MLHEGCVSKRLLALVRKLEDVPKDSWEEVRLIDRKVTANLVKKTITDAIRNYNDTQMNK